MKKLLLLILIVPAFRTVRAQVSVSPIAGDYKVINVGNNGYGDYTRAVILLHQMYNGTLIGTNYSIGTLTALRGSTGSFNRIDIAQLNTASAYAETSGNGISNDNDGMVPWRLKTCMYNGAKYLAVDIPYSDAYHDHGYYFTGWTASTGENMKCVAYLVRGQAVNQSLISNIQDFSPDIIETHDAAQLNVTGSVGIGTTNPGSYKLAVNGGIHSQSVNVDLTGWSDYVFKKDYQLPTLQEVKSYIDRNHHLPDMPSEQEVIKDGINVGEMNRLLTKKVEELTLYLIEKDNAEQKQQQFNQKLEAELNTQKINNQTQHQEIEKLNQQLKLLLKKMQTKQELQQVK